jgi:hypothetical protein
MTFSGGGKGERDKPERQKQRALICVLADGQASPHGADRGGYLWFRDGLLSNRTRTLDSEDYMPDPDRVFMA